MKMTLVLIGLVVGVAGLIVIVGSMLPVKHVATRSVNLKTSQSRIWEAISDFKNSQQWRDDLKTVEHVEQTPGIFVWRETAKNGDVLNYITLEALPEKRLVRKIASEGLPFGGTWTFEINTANGTSILSITENGEVYNPIFRFVSRFVFGHHASIDKYLSQLKHHLGEV